LRRRCGLLQPIHWSRAAIFQAGDVFLDAGVLAPGRLLGLFLGQDAVDLLSAGPFLIDHDQRLGVHGLLTFDPEGPLWCSSSVRYDSGLVSNPSDPVEVAADPDFSDLLRYVNLDAETPRVRPRTIVDVAAGFDFADARSRRTWGVQLQITNLTNRTALYNFQSVFVGTRLVQPRTVSLRISRNF